jgi:hypothetical protein
MHEPGFDDDRPEDFSDLITELSTLERKASRLDQEIQDIIQKKDSILTQIAMKEYENARFGLSAEPFDSEKYILRRIELYRKYI